MNIQEFRQKYPEYNDMSDQALADAFYKKSYAYMDRKEFDSKFLNIPQATTPAKPEMTDPMAEQVGMFQPENLLPSMETIKSQAPIAGAMITAPFKTSPILAPISGMGASAAALMAGQGAEPMMQGETPDIQAASMGQFNAPLGPLAMGVGGEAGAQTTLKLAEKALSPFAKSFAARLMANPEAKMAQEMVEQGAPISPSEIHPTKTAWIANVVSENVFPGSKIVNHYRRKVSEFMMKLRDDFIESQLKMPKFDSSIPEARTKSRELFGKFVEEAGGKEAQIPMNETISFIENNMSNPITSTDIWWKKKFIPWMKGPTDKTVDEINSLHASYNRSWGRLTPVAKELRNGLRESIYKDLAKYDDVMGSMVEPALKTAQEATKDIYDIAKARWIEKALLQPSTKPIQNSLQMVFDPYAFKKAVQNNMTKIEVMFPETKDLFMKFADKTMVASKDISKSMQNVGGRQLTEAGPFIGTAAVLYYPWLALPLGMEGVLAHSFMNPSGYFRKFLTSGLTPPKMIAKEVPKLIGMEATND